MTDQEKQVWSLALAELYVMRRNIWFSAIDRGNHPAKQIAAARVDQLNEVIDTLPEDIKGLTKREIKRIG